MKIIYISGIDGCGKTTQAKKLVEILKKQGLNAEYKWLRWEPTFQKVFYFIMAPFVKKKEPKSCLVEKENNEYLRTNNFKEKILSNPVLRSVWFFHACLDYYLKTKRILKQIKSDIVVVDRYVDDFIIDQALNFCINPQKAHKMMDNYFMSRFPNPDFKVIIDLPAQIAYQRKHDGTPLSSLEKREEYYKDFFDTKNAFHLDGIQDISSLAGGIESLVKKQLKGN